jgi:hypothetical protein
VPVASLLPPGRPLPPHVTVHRVRARHRYLLAKRPVIKLIRMLAH